MPVAEAEVLPDAELDVPPVMWNGKEYWRVGVEDDAVESSTISNPYVAKELEEGTVHVYFPRVLSMLFAITAPAWRVLGVAPWRRVIVIVPVTVPGCQTISKDDPAGMFWSWVGEVIASKPEVWARTEETSAKTAAEMKE